MPGMNSRHWDVILDVLADGPIEDPSGLATTKLMAATGHESTNALAKLLRRMEMEGLIERDISGRRTTRIALTKAAAAKARRSRPAPVAEVPAPSPNGDSADGVDYDLLAAALLAKALKATQAQEAAAGAKDATARAQRAEARLAIAEADAQAARAKVAELEATLRLMEKNLQTLQAQLNKPQRSTGVPIKERLDRQTLKELDQLMRALPGARG